MHYVDKQLHNRYALILIYTPLRIYTNKLSQSPLVRSKDLSIKEGDKIKISFGKAASVHHSSGSNSSGGVFKLPLPPPADTVSADAVDDDDWTDFA